MFDTMQRFIYVLFLFFFADLSEELNIVSRESTLVTLGEQWARDCGAWR